LLLLIAVAELARRSDGPWAGLIAVIGVLASPRAFSFGGKVMVETFLSLWILLALALASRLLTEPGRKLAVGLGLVTGLALLTKTTAVFLLAGAIAWCLWRASRRDQDRVSRLRALAYAVMACVVLAAPWYVHNASRAARFALFSSRFNVVAEGRSHLISIWDRLAIILADLPGWPLVTVLGTSALVVSAARWCGWDGASSGFAERQPSSLQFRLMTAASLIGATAVLMVPSYFDTRFLLPLWPAVSVALGGATARLVANLGFVPRMLAGAGLAASVLISTVGLAREPIAPTYWSATKLIDRLVSLHGVSILANVGNIETWNVCKTGLINELRSNPSDCFVLHDLSAETREGLGTRLPRFDAVIVLEPSAYPAGFVAAAPGLNRAAAMINEIVRADPGLVRLDDLPFEGLPPMSVYLRRRENGKASPAPARQVSRSGRAVPSTVR
jgi:4-amino-4-deoxy-L-arabinose transferase-like glycosyltransferase